MAQAANHMKIEAQQFINPMLNALKLRNIVSKNKRHSVQRPIRPEQVNPQTLVLQRNLQMGKRKSVIDYFFLYTRNVLPKMEEKLELQLLQRFKSRISNDAERKEVMEAYYQRKDNLAKMIEPDDLRVPEPEAPLN